MMKPKTMAKKMLSVILCVVMLVSCWVFTAPQASATDATTVAELVAERATASGLYMYYSAHTYIKNTLNGNGCFEETTLVSEFALWYVESVSGGYKIYTYVNGAKKYIHNSSEKNVELADTGDTFTITPNSGGFYLKKSDEDKWLQHSGSGGGLRYYTDNNNATNSIIKFEYPETYEMPTTYNYTVRFTTSDKLDCNDNNGVHVYIRTKSNSGSNSNYTQTELPGGGKSGDWMKMVQNGTTTSKSGKTSAYCFPYAVYITIDGDAGIGDHNWRGKCYLTVNGVTIINGANCHVEAGGGVWHEVKTVTQECANSSYPTINSITPITGKEVVNVPVTDTTESATYTPGKISDQYGVRWYQGTPSITAVTQNNCSFSSNTLYVPNNANRASDYSCTLTQSYSETGHGSASNSKLVSIKTFNYNVTFKNYDGTVIDDSQTNLEYGTSATPPANPTRPSTDTIDYTFSHWEPAGNYDYTNLSGVQEQVYTAQYTESDRHYTVTFQKEDGTVISSNSEMLYQSVPSQAGIVPELIDKAPDDNGHYTAAWDRDVTQPITGDTIFKIVYTLVPHTWVDPAGVVKTPATCVATGIKVVTCSVCNHEVEQEIPIDSNAHTTEIAYGEKPGDDVVGKVYFYCKNGCGKCFPAIDNGTEFVANLAVPCDTSTAAQDDESAAKVPCPSFNTYKDDTIGGYQYSLRGASLKLSNEADRGLNTIQKMRFSGSVMVPVGMETTIDPANYTKYQAKQYDSIPDDSVIDFGFVYTQHRCLLYDGDDGSGYYTVDPTKFEMGKDNIYSMSVVHKNENSGTFDFGENNWNGVTAHNENNETTLTFNLLINVTQKNWKRNYAARTYIIYKYHGEIYLVYDNMVGGTTISDRAVWYVAKAVLAMYDEGEETSPAALNMVNYIKEKIVRDDQKVEKAIFDYAQKQESTPMDYFSDWWKAYNGRGLPVDETYDPEF